MLSENEAMDILIATDKEPAGMGYKVLIAGLLALGLCFAVVGMIMVQG